MEVIQLKKRISQVVTYTQEELAKAFLRPQECYESPEFKGQIFSLTQFEHWYTENSPEGKKTGKFTYYEDWCGFNIPSYILDPFYAGKFDPLSSEEKTFLKAFEKQREGQRFYIIGTIKGDTETRNHETAHALFYLNKKYKKKSSKIVKKLPKKTIKFLLNEVEVEKGEYHPDTFTDEIQAYLLSSISTETLEKIPHKKKVMRAYNKLEDLFVNTFSKMK